MNDTLKINLKKLVIFMLISASIPLLSLTFPYLPDIIRQIVMLGVTIFYPLSCLLVIVFGGSLIFTLPCNKFFRRLIFIAWFPFYTLLAWFYANLIIFFIISI